MNNKSTGIKKTITKGVYFLFFLVSFYILFQLFIFFISDNILQKNTKVSEYEKAFYAYNSSLMELESVFLNYNLGYIPSPKKVKSLAEENKRLLNELKKYKKLKNKNIFTNLITSSENLHKDLSRFFEMKSNSSESLIILKDINEQFFVSRLFLVKYKDFIQNEIKSNLSNLNTAQYINLASLIILVLISVVIFYYSLRMKNYIAGKIQFLQDSIASFSIYNKNFYVSYKEDDEFRDIISKFNSLTKTISDQHEKILQSEKRFRHLYDNSPDALILMSKNLRIEDCNLTALKLFCCKDVEEFIKYGEEALFTENLSENQTVYDFFYEHALNVLSKDSGFFECRLKKADKTFFSASVLMSRTVIENITYIQATIRDISEQKKESERKIQYQKMETIGTLAGGLAHDFNNVLSGIIGPVSIIEYMADNDKLSKKDLAKYIKTISSSSERAKNIVEQLLSLSRKKEITNEYNDLNIIIENVIHIAENSFDKSVSVDFFKSSEKSFVEGDKTQLEQVFLNLLINSAHSMTIMRKDTKPWGGTIRIEIEKYPDEQKASGNDLKFQNYWKVNVSDSGIGMSQDTIKKIFNPFFTTKDKGSGTGLGLSMAYSIVDQHHGFMNVYSEPGTGTSFNIYLPASDKVGHTDFKSEDNFVLPLCSGLVLVVDDEEIMRDLASDILKRCGFEVITAENGKKGLELYKENKNSIKFVLLDMVMPELSGKETFNALKNINPDVKVIICSGFKEDDRVKDVMSSGAHSFIKKPYSLVKLSEAVKQIS
ncbi:MAG: response regulator [Thermodesulfobacteriota bacterium]